MVQQCPGDPVQPVPVGHLVVVDPGQRLAGGGGHGRVARPGQPRPGYDQPLDRDTLPGKASHHVTYRVVAGRVVHHEHAEPPVLLGQQALQAPGQRPGAVAGTHDYFSWNRARWDMLRVAEALGATPDEIDGGFEYNGFKRHEIHPRGSPSGKMWWWVKDDRYIVAFTEVPGYETVERRSVKRWLATTPAEVRLLRRK